MGYIIENANILKEKKLSTSSLLIEGEHITAKKEHIHHNKLIKMNAESYIMTPSYVLLDTRIPLNAAFQEFRAYMVEKFLMKGCTTLFTYSSITYESELTEKIRETKTALISSPVDFLISVKIPLRLLTPSFIRKCKKERVPAIFIDVEDLDELNNMPWGWIKEALFPYNCPLVPLISNHLKKDAKRAMSKWKDIMENQKIPAILQEIKENQPLSISVLNKIGLYPQKASLLHGAEVSYNLFHKAEEIINVDEVELFHYHSDRLLVTVHKGKVVRAGEEVLFKPGYGEYVRVRTPSYFAL
ncbi:hypothetical protein P9D43_05425 [Neobacillus niacini]|uniref:hypothetical protein n=1 Tax=Neobacillus niacini TaxID=86668 RepID=UPI00052F535D|nr:hypothetical protein [Neobacillus niacini]KGM45131.1 hypothetical protein NP83_07690 [Neobacillus niacini]MEC1521486.1 hypothetical protein [Neobacillus niacini]